jgi:UDP-GlcNAc:undecaprenyl-phosphate/decaprenyl-phosphate GlcNAc-1-phosphate transferase
MIFLSTLLVSVLLTALTVPVLSRLALRYSLVDIPSERKVHTQPIPRVGGLAMAIGMVAPVVYWIGDDGFVQAFLAGAGVLILFGFLDDYRDLPPRWKFVGQGAAACIAVFCGGVQIHSLGMLAPDDFLLPGWVSIPLTILTIVGVTNAINLADGLDGLAGGISLLSLCCVGYLAYLEGDSTIGLVALALAGAIFGFLRYNTFPATIFMGDVGSQLLGFSTITLALFLTQGSTPLSPLLPLIILGFPILDTLTVMATRIARGGSPFSADKTHFHHALLALGLHQTESVLVIYLIQVSLIAAAFFLRFYSDWLLLAGYLLFSCTVLTVFSRSRRNNWQPKRIALLLKAKIWLRWLRDNTLLMKYLSRPLEVGLPVILLLTAALTGKVSGYAALTALVAMVLLGIILFLCQQHLEGWLRTALYLLIPLIIYQSAIRLDSVPAGIPVHVYNLSFAALALLNVLVSKLTRRTHGFQSTPLDFLILFVAFVAPYLAGSNLPANHLGMIAAKIIICYFSCEVLFAELRGNLRWVTGATFAMLAILVLQGIR